MTNFHPISGHLNRRSVAIRLAIVLTVSAWALSCTDTTAAAPVTPTHPARVFTAVVIMTGSAHDTILVGQSLGLSVLTVDQFGVTISVDALNEQMSDTTVAAIVSMPPVQPWDYGNDEFVVGARPGDATLTVTATRSGVSHSASRPITVLPAVH